ncbi:hypothetical protein Acr_07g0010040 [Actinidia rufa]|uniref:Uncharacterized protein n=1 Tax=Actinidia rufa TaxID=165716 RepID=A0A7J0EYU8_9ERIC|nr:hypothetical protein Acr_07g0010040 [Actinidia rufa]
MRKVLPRLPDLTLLRLLGGKVRPSVPGLKSDSSSSSSNAWLDPRLLPELRSYAMSKKFSLKKLAHIDGGSKGACAQQRASDVKGKGSISPTEEKKKSPAKAKMLSSKAKIIAEIRASTSANPGAVLGPRTSILKNPVVAKKLIEGVIPPLDKAEANKLELDRAISRLFQGIGEKLASDLERQLADVRIREHQAVDELKNMKEDRATTVVRLEAEVSELKKGEALDEKKAIEEFKSSNDFQGGVEFIASRYFGEGFDFCKRQLGCLHPDLDIQNMGIDADLLEEEEEKEEEEEEKEKGKEGNLTRPQRCSIYPQVHG